MVRSRGGRATITSLAQQLQGFATLLEQALPVEQTPIIASREEAHAIGKYLVAHVRGEEDAFHREQRLGWQLVKRVLGRIEHVISGEGVSVHQRVRELDECVTRAVGAG